MSSRPLKIAVGLATAAVLTLAAAPAQAADSNPFAWTQLTPTYAATGQYAYEPLAQAGGYQRMNTCRPGLGYHYVNPEFLDSVDPAEPAVLVYEDGPGNTRRLVAVEWAVADTGQDTPELFGQKFSEGQHPGYFTLHAWLYKSNPDGLFKSPNPTVMCATAS